MLHQLQYDSPLGTLTLCSGDGTHLTALHLNENTAPSTLRSLPPIFQEVSRWLDTYFAGQIPGPLPPLAPAGTPFQQIVWKFLLEIPYGQVVSYGTIAQKTAAALEKPHMSAQAVGGAVGRNPIPILIPCHRVVGANGSLTGYSGGLPIKKSTPSAGRSANLGGYCLAPSILFMSLVSS